MNAKKLALDPAALSRRERQILDILLRLGRATASDVEGQLPDSPSYSAVRTHLRILEDKGYVKHQAEGPRYVYSPAVDPKKARQSALAHLVRTYFSGSVELAVAGLLDERTARLSREELDRLAAMIERARKEK